MHAVICICGMYYSDLLHVQISTIDLQNLSGIDTVWHASASCVLYAGKFKATDLIAFLSERAGAAGSSEADDSPTQESEDSSSSSQKSKTEERKDPQIVHDLNMTQLEGLSDEEDAWLVSFYSGLFSSQTYHVLFFTYPKHFQAHPVTCLGFFTDLSWHLFVTSPCHCRHKSCRL